MYIIASSWGYLHDNLLPYVKKVQMTPAVNMTLVLNINQIQEKKTNQKILRLTQDFLINL